MNPLRWLLACFLCLPTLSVAQEGPRLVDVERFVSLPLDVRQPEGLTVDPISGALFVGTFDARTPESTRNNRVLRFDLDGRLQA